MKVPDGYKLSITSKGAVLVKEDPLGDVFEDISVPPHRDHVILREQILHQLKLIIDPDLGQDIVTLNFVKDLVINYDDSKVSFTLELTTPACPVKDDFVEAAERLLKELGWIETVEINLTARKHENKIGDPNVNLQKVSYIIAVASCKGGVGKSSIACNLSFMLKRLGATVGLVDADIYGPSLPSLVPVQNPQVYFCSSSVDKSEAKNELNSGKGSMLPVEYDGVKMMSYGYFRPEDSAYAAVRGPIAGSLVCQMVTQTMWGSLDYLIVDLPPGSGDIHLTLCQTVKFTGAVVVTTPQKLSLVDVRKGIHFFNTVGIPILTLVENLAGFICPDCSKIHQIFPSHPVFDLETKLWVSSPPPSCISQKEKIKTTEESEDEDSSENEKSQKSCQEVKKSSNCQTLSTEELPDSCCRQGDKHSHCGCGGEEEGFNKLTDNNNNNNKIKNNNNNIKLEEIGFHEGVDGIVKDFGIPVHFKIPIDSIFASTVFRTGYPSNYKFNYPFTNVFDQNNSTWCLLRDLSNQLIRVASGMTFAGNSIPELQTHEDGYLQVVLKCGSVSQNASSSLQEASQSSSEQIFLIAQRNVRLSCRCASCVDEFTGQPKLNQRNVPLDVHIIKMQQTGNYAVTIEWSDHHSSIVPFASLIRQCREESKAIKPNSCLDARDELEW